MEQSQSQESQDVQQSQESQGGQQSQGTNKEGSEEESQEESEEESEEEKYRKLLYSHSVSITCYDIYTKCVEWTFKYTTMHVSCSCYYVHNRL